MIFRSIPARFAFRVVAFRLNPCSRFDDIPSVMYEVVNKIGAVMVASSFVAMRCIDDYCAAVFAGEIAHDAFVGGFSKNSVDLKMIVQF